MMISDLKRTVLAVLPAGDPLPDGAWAKRHRAILVLLWLHVPALAIVGTVTQHGFLHSMMEASIVAVLAMGGTLSGFGRLKRSAFTTVGLIASSAILVHFSEGLIEMHFHFFVMVAIVTLYQSWLPFLLAIAFVVLHHGTVGILSPGSVFNHGSAISDPWKWALIHGMFIAGASAAGLAAWKLNEVGMAAERMARNELEGANSELAAAQSMASIGSWDWHVSSGRVWWSEELYRIMGQMSGAYTPTVEGFLKLVDHADRDRVQAIIGRSGITGKDFQYVTRIVRPDRSVRVIEALGRAVVDPAGEAIHMSGTVQDITDRKALEEKVEHQAFHDSLTDLANRALFLDRVEHALLRQSRGTSALAVLFVDLDDFKAVNDSMGHAIGDDLLIEVSLRVSGLLRPADTVARLGGDEFAILLEDIEEVDYAESVAQRILDLLTTPFSVGGSELFVTASIGMAFSSPKAPLPSGELMSQADTAMYAAKRQGKGRVERFRTGMEEEAVERLRLRADLQQAVDNSQFVLHYQPVVTLDSGQITGVEALIRWEHPERGLIGPADFIPFAEENGLIMPIGHWVIKEACRTATRWSAESAEDRPLTIAVNISGVRFRHPGFVEELTEVLDETGLDPSRLVLEITEGILVQDADQVAGRLAELKKLGVSVAIDDFGTGYSSLSYLRKFPIDILKVDKTFIDSVAMGPEESALARAIIKLGHTLGLTVIAEGVEEGLQASALQALGCEYGQGFLFAKPLDLNALEALLANEQKGRSTSHAPKALDEAL